MSFSKQGPYEYAVKELNYWKTKAINSGRSLEPWNDTPSRFRSDYDVQQDDMQWQNDRMNSGSRSDRLSPYGSNYKQLSSSNQVNTNLFGNFSSSGSNRMNTSMSNSYSPRIGQSRYPYQSGRIERNQLSDYTRQRRILQKRALNSLGSTSTNVPAVKRKRGPRVKKTTKPAESDKKETPKKDETDKDKITTTTGTFNKVDPELRIAINWVNDTKTNISKDQASLITARLEEAMDQLPEDAHVPKFFASGLSVGVYKFVCADKPSMEWIKETVASFPELWEGANLTVIEQSEISSLVLVTLFLIDNDADIVVLLKRFEKQNPDVKTGKWRVHHEGKDGKERVIVFGIDRESFDLLKKNEFRLFLGLRRVKFALGVAKSK